MNHHVVDPKPFKSRLTAREREVVQLLAEGKTSKESPWLSTRQTQKTHNSKLIDISVARDDAFRIRRFGTHRRSYKIGLHRRLLRVSRRLSFRRRSAKAT